MSASKKLFGADSGIVVSQASDEDERTQNKSTSPDALHNSDHHITSTKVPLKPLTLSEPVTTSEMEAWDVQATKQWLIANGFSEIGEVLCDEHRIDGSVLLSMTEEDLLLPLLNLRVFGDVRRLSTLLDSVRREHGDTVSPRLSRRHHPYDRERHRSPSSFSTGSDFPAEYDVSKRRNKSKDLRADYKKMVAAMAYAQVVLWLTSYTMVVVHDRVPDVEKYPPLPDLVLDNVPYIPWAFQAVETIGISMMSCLICILIFHKHRTIIWRRCCALTGTVFLLRCVTMLITSLSVPGAHLKCDPSQYPETWMRLHRAFVIWSGFGMTLQGVRTCGDYMFSGHTTVITMLNMLITEYTPSRWYPLHTATWVANLFGIFFILAAHEHYSIDVFVAFYISSRLFLYYHSLANTSRIQKDRRTRIWFPLFSYFEENVDGDIPNEYELPVSTNFFLNKWRAAQTNLFSEKKD